MRPPTPHTSHLTTHISHLTPHNSHLTPHISQLTAHSSQLTPPHSTVLITDPTVCFLCVSCTLKVGCWVQEFAHELLGLPRPSCVRHVQPFYSKRPPLSEQAQQLVHRLAIKVCS